MVAIWLMQDDMMTGLPDDDDMLQEEEEEEEDPEEDEEEEDDEGESDSDENEARWPTCEECGAAEETRVCKRRDKWLCINCMHGVHEPDPEADPANNEVHVSEPDAEADDNDEDETYDNAKFEPDAKRRRL
jgi:hypothetical protein